jgi:hypothetical protein
MSGIRAQVQSGDMSIGQSISRFPRDMEHRGRHQTPCSRLVCHSSAGDGGANDAGAG